uniref:Uncharacterized protein n=1 Tax=Anguilla anguilla TaxID=7936 RepID=A0A0E9RHK1_ANGAN
MHTQSMLRRIISTALKLSFKPLHFSSLLNQ